MKRMLRKVDPVKVPFIIFPVLTGGVFVSAKHSPNFLENFYYAVFYSQMVPQLAKLSALCSFSLTLVSFLLILVLLIAMPLTTFMLQRRSPHRIVLSLLHGFATLLITAVNLLCLYLWLWGFHYIRTPLVRIGHQNEINYNDMRNVMTEFAQKTNLLRAELHENDEGCIANNTSLEELDKDIEILQLQLLQKLGFPEIRGVRTKMQPFSDLWLSLGSAGIYGPFTAERNISWPTSPGQEAVLIAHERAHFAGFAAESHADFIGIATVLSSRNPMINYSGWLRIWSLVKYSEATTYPLSDAVKQDLLCTMKFWDKHLGSGHDLARDLYDELLKAQGVSSGIENYSEALKLVIQYADVIGLQPK